MGVSDDLNSEVLIGARAISQMPLPELAKHYGNTREAAFAIRGQAKSIVRMNDEARVLVGELLELLPDQSWPAILKARAFLHKDAGK